MNKTLFEKIVRAARMALLENIQGIANIANGSETYLETRLVGGEPTPVEVSIKPSDRINAAKLLKDIVLNKEALDIKDEADEFEVLNPYERQRVLMEALAEVEEELDGLQ